MEKPMVSIITPVYNVSVDYLRECYESIVNSTYSRWKWIIVDDGSTDSGLLDFYDSLGDSRVRLLFSQHQGVSHARNVALNAVDTEYFVFVDADDKLAPYFLEHSVAIARRDHAGIVMGRVVDFSREFSAKTLTPVSSILFSQPTELLLLRKYLLSAIPPQGFTFDDPLQLSAHDGVLVNTHPGGKLIDTSILNGITFNEGMTVSEDALFCIELSQQTNRITLVDETFYGYRRHSGSTMAKTSIDSLVSELVSYTNLYQVAISHQLDMDALGLRYLAKIGDRIIYHPNKLSIAEISFFLKRAEENPMFTASEGCSLSNWQLTVKRKITYTLLKRRCNFLVAWLLKMGTHLHETE